MPKKIKTKTKNEEKLHDDDTESFHNSEDEYVLSESSGDESVDDNSQQLSGGDSNELGDDSDNLDVDPDDQADPDRDDKYDPINDSKEEEDPDNADDYKDAGDYESVNSEQENVDADNVDETDMDGNQHVGESKQCHIKDLNKDNIVLDEDDSNMYGKMAFTKIPNENRETDPYMTYYEMVRIIGTRAQQFNFGAKPLVKGLDGLPPQKKAYVELIAKMTPFIIKRHLPGKKYEEWRIDELELVHEISDNFFVPENFDYDALMNQIKLPNKNNNSDSDSESKSRISNTKNKKLKN